MNAKTLANHYSHLTAEERFRLILAASARDDHTEQDRLASAGERITLRMPDHSPFAHAFQELALLTFIELQDEAARYDYANEQSSDDLKILGSGGGNRSAFTRSRALAVVSGFVLRTKADGWKLFCERWNFPPFLVWEFLPGFDRLQRSLERAEKEAFRPAEMVKWLNDIRSTGKPEVNEAGILNVEQCANASETAFHERSRWWGGY